MVYNLMECLLKVHQIHLNVPDISVWILIILIMSMLTVKSQVYLK